MTSPRILAVIRHSQAEPDARTDYERVLARRGERDVAALAGWLVEQRVVADAALVSSAVRTRQTWQQLAVAAGWGVAADYEDALYGGDEYDVLRRASEVEESVRTLVVVGHNPAVHGLATAVDDGEGDQESRSRLASEFPTSTVALFDLEVSWRDLGPGVGTLRGLHVARA